MNSYDTASTALLHLLAHARQNHYRGYNKHDGLMSPLLHRLLGRSRWGRLIAIQTIMRSPVNIRPLFAVPKTRNPKGSGLFAQASLDASICLENHQLYQQAEEILQWLRENRSTGFSGMSWGYQYPWQDVGFFAPAGFPNRVVTCWIGFAFARAYEISHNPDFLEVCRDICTFLSDSPNRIIDTETELCLSYVPDPGVTWAVMDVSALCGKMYALCGIADDDRQMLAAAKRCMTYVINRQTEYGAWYYTDPPKDSHILHDNYHTGIILDCILDYMTLTKDWTHLPGYIKGLDYYRDQLFLPNGAPKWMNNQVYPHDIHGAAQGIITFSKASRLNRNSLNQAEGILNWTMANLYNPQNGSFWYQKTHFFTKKFTLLRWCNAWMARALAEYLQTR